MVRICHIVRKNASLGCRFMTFYSQYFYGSLKKTLLDTPLRNYGSDEIVQTVDRQSRFNVMLKMNFNLLSNLFWLTTINSF